MLAISYSIHILIPYLRMRAHELYDHDIGDVSQPIGIVCADSITRFASADWQQRFFQSADWHHLLACACSGVEVYMTGMDRSSASESIFW